jgi:EPS-associated MarR family transcriptional regulator
MDNMTRQQKLQEDTHFRVLILLEKNPDMTQRDLAKALGVSLGGLNYSLKAMMVRGMVKVKNFSKSERKLSYTYLLTPQGLSEKTNLTTRFLRRKMDEYVALKYEIDSLQSALNSKRQSDLVFDNEHYQSKEPGSSK